MDLRAGGTVTNAAVALISDVVDAVLIIGGNGTVANSGTLNATGTDGIGLRLATGGSVTNNAGGLIAGGNGVFLEAASAALTNSGTIEAAIDGIRLYNTASVTNAAGGLITGSASGVDIGSGGGTVTNSGTVQGTGTASVGARLSLGGLVDNGTGGIINGVLRGAEIEAGGGTVGNSGTIAAAGNPLYSSGIYFFGAGLVTNYQGGLISGSRNGVLFRYYGANLGSLVNFGQIQGIGPFGHGVDFQAGDAVVNAAGGLISGYLEGVVVESGGGTLSNSGTVIGTARFSDGVQMLRDGTVTNYANADLGPCGRVLRDGHRGRHRH